MFDPFATLVLPGQALKSPRTQLPNFGRGYVENDAPTDTGWISRCFLASAAIRILGVDIGVGIFYRKPLP